MRALGTLHPNILEVQITKAAWPEGAQQQSKHHVTALQSQRGTASPQHLVFQSFVSSSIWWRESDLLQRAGVKVMGYQLCQSPLRAAMDSAGLSSYCQLFKCLYLAICSICWVKGECSQTWVDIAKVMSCQICLWAYEWVNRMSVSIQWDIIQADKGKEELGSASTWIHLENI